MTEGEIMDLQAVLRLYDREERRDAEFPDMTKEAFPRVVRFVRPTPETGYVLYSDLDETTVDAAIDEQLARFSRNGMPFEWKVYSHDRPPDLVGRLVARGFEAEEPDAIMVLDMAVAPEALLRPPVADVRRLSDPTQLDDVVGVLEPVWGENFDWIHARLGAHMAIPGYLSVHVAYVDGTPACVGWTYYSSSSFAGLWGGSTLEAYRGRGLYTDVLAARVREAKGRGVDYLTVDAGSMSMPILARQGFEAITWATACNWEPAETA